MLFILMTYLAGFFSGAFMLCAWFYAKGRAEKNPEAADTQDAFSKLPEHMKKQYENFFAYEGRAREED